MTVSEAAKALGVSAQAVRKAIKTGRLRPTSTNPTTLDPAEVEAFRVEREGKDLSQHAEEIRRQAAQGMTQADIALNYGVHQKTIGRLLRGETYR